MKQTTDRVRLRSAPDKKKTRIKRILAAAMAAVMAVCMIPMTVFAAETTVVKAVGSELLYFYNGDCDNPLDYFHTYKKMAYGGEADGYFAYCLSHHDKSPDSNGATSDICIQVPSENCVVRVSMYVSPMGRDVIFYLYPSDYTAGNNTDMNATIVTAASGSSSGTSSGTGSASAGSSTAGGSSSGSTAGGASGGSSLGSNSLSAAGLADTDTGEETDGSEAPALSSSIEEAADPATDGELSDAQGLSLSTASDGSGEEETDGASGSGVFAVAAAVMVTGLVFMGAAAAIVYFFRRNWRRWGGGYEDDED